MGPDRSSLQPIEMTAPEGVHRDMALDRPGTQYFAGPVKVMSDEERIRYERMMHPVPTTFQEFMDNQKFVFHVMDYSNLMPPSPRSQQSAASGAPLNHNANQEDEEDEDENPESDAVFQPFDRPETRTHNSDPVRIIPSDFLTQQFLESVNNRKKGQSHGSGDFSDSPDEPRPRRGHTGQQRQPPVTRGRGDPVPYDHPYFLTPLRQKQATPFPVKERNLDDLFVQADRNIEEIAQMKQTANFLLTSIGRMLVQKAQMQQQKKSVPIPEEKWSKKTAEDKVPVSTESESKMDHLLDVADQDIAKLSQKTNQTDKLMDLISEILTSSLSRKQQKAKTLEEKESPTAQLSHGDNFPFLPFFSPISIQRKEHGGQSFGTEKPGYLFLGEPMVVPAGQEVESSTGSALDPKLLSSYSLLPPPTFDGKPLDDHPDDPESGDVVDDDDDDDEYAQTVTSEVMQSDETVTPKVMVREKRVSKAGMFRTGRND